MQQLALDGLLQFKGEGEEQRVVILELYVALAEREAAASSRILLAGFTNIEAVQWAELERVVLVFKREDAGEVMQDCQKLQVLYASEQTFSKKGLQLKDAKALLLLKVKNCKGKLRGLKAVPKLAVLHQIWRGWLSYKGWWCGVVKSLQEIQGGLSSNLQTVTLYSVKCLPSQTGEVYYSEASECDYINRIVSSICLKLPPPFVYDVSYAKGQRRFIQEGET